MTRQPDPSAATSPLLDVVHVSKTFPYRAGPFRRQIGTIRAVDDVSLQVRPGEILGLVGESGCGKTTLAKLIAQLLPVTSGEIRFEGRRLSGQRLSRDERKNIQLVFQDPTSSLNPRQRVGAIVEEPLLVHRVCATTAERRAAVERLLEQVGLPRTYLRRFPRELSGGERQRVAIARALALKPRLLILDEPVASLDVHVGAQVLELLRALHQAEALTYLMISHDLRVVGSLCTRIAVMYLGRVVEAGAAADVLRTPWHPYTELLLESAGLRAAGVQDRGEIPSPLDPPSGCVFRTRCPLAESICERQVPALCEKGARRLVACHKRP